jgi:hypothetical protein
MSDDIRDAIVALKAGDSNQFKDAIQANLMSRAMDTINLQKINAGQSFFDEPEVEVDDTDPETEEVSDEEI